MNRHERRKTKKLWGGPSLAIRLPGSGVDVSRKMTAAAANSVMIGYRGKTMPIPVNPIITSLAEQEPWLLKEYAKQYAHALDAAIAAQGEAAFESTKRAAAIHEAGHIVHGCSEGIVTSWATIWEEDGTSIVTGAPMKCWGGWTEATYLDRSIGEFGSTMPLEHNLRLIKQMAAGYIAEMAFPEDDFGEGSSLDEMVAATILCTGAYAWSGGRGAAGAKDLLGQMQQDLGNFLLERKGHVLAVADALMVAYPNKLEGAEIARILAA